ncbi:MAG: hypothetical protein J6R77_03660 [Clostridia bacterium]|nr:hypothetical protein [Clostridia bacterium]
MEFQGVSISESLLLRYAIVSSVMILLFIGVTVWLAIWGGLIFFRDPQNKKAKKRLQTLQARAETDERARHELARLMRKEEKRRRNERHGRVGYVVLMSLVGLIVTAAVVFWVAPMWRDYAQKDYAIYDGTFSVVYQHKGWYTVIPEGRSFRWLAGFSAEDTYLRGSGELETGTYTGRVVYAPRSEIVVGIEPAEDAP